MNRFTVNAKPTSQIIGVYPGPQNPIKLLLHFELG